MQRASTLFLSSALTITLSACGSSSADEAPPERAESSLTGAIVEAATREAAGMRTKALDTPLPGGVEPTFTYGVIADMSSPLNATVTMRQVALQAQAIDARDAYDAIAAQYEAAGFQSGGMSENKGAFSGGFSTGGEGNGLAAVDGGGTYVMLIASPIKSGSDSERNGITANVSLTIYTPKAP